LLLAVLQLHDLDPMRASLPGYAPYDHLCGECGARIGKLCDAGHATSLLGPSLDAALFWSTPRLPEEMPAVTKKRFTSASGL